jgi:hypothetical protein
MSLLGGKFGSGAETDDPCDVERATTHVSFVTASVQWLRT